MIQKKFNVISNDEETQINSFGDKTYWHIKTIYKNKNTRSYLYEQTVKWEYLEDGRMLSSETVYINELELSYFKSNSVYLYKNDIKTGKRTHKVSYKDKDFTIVKEEEDILMTFKDKRYYQKIDKWTDNGTETVFNWTDGSRLLNIVETDGNCDVNGQTLGESNLLRW